MEYGLPQPHHNYHFGTIIAIQSSYRGSPIIASLVSQSLSALVENWLMWPWRVKIHAFSPKVTQPLLVLLYRILPNQTSCCASFVNVFMLKFCQEFEAKVWSRFWGRILLKFKKVSKIAHASCSWWFIKWGVCLCCILLLCDYVVQNKTKLEFEHELSQL